MKIMVLLTAALLAFTPIAFADDSPNSGNFSVYRSDQILVPSHITKGSPDGSIRVYRANKRGLIVPTHIIRQNPTGYSVYPSGKPVVPTYRGKTLGDVTGGNPR